MRFHVLTLFPQMIEQGLSESITGRALKQNIISLNTVNIRDFAHNKHNKVDDYTYGGGAGMLMQAEPVYQAVSSVVSQINKCNQVHSGDNSLKNALHSLVRSLSARSALFIRMSLYLFFPSSSMSGLRLDSGILASTSSITRSINLMSSCI